MEFENLSHTRWSPREFTTRKVENNLLVAIFDAARWAQSSFNEQPWRYVIATKDEQPLRERLESYLVEGNAYAKEGWVLGISFAKLTFTRNGKPNRVAVHDLGAANQAIALKAFELGVNSRFMAGFDTERAQEIAPENYEPVAMFVIGYAKHEVLKQGPGDRGRKPVQEFVYGGEWERGYEF